MPTGIPLTELVSDLRAEVGHSLNVSHGQNTEARFRQLLRRTQRTLWMENEFPNLMLWVYTTLSAGQKLYSYPSTLPFENIRQIYTKDGSVWVKLGYGVGPEQYNVYNSDADERSTPVRMWEHRPSLNQFEVWPIPSQSGELAIRGQQALTALVADEDTCTLDSDVIVLHAAASILAAAKSEEAPVKAQEAQRHLRAVKTRQGAHKSNPFILGGGGADQRRLRPGIDYIPEGYGS